MCEYRIAYIQATYQMALMSTKGQAHAKTNSLACELLFLVFADKRPTV